MEPAIDVGIGEVVNQVVGDSVDRGTDEAPEVIVGDFASHGEDFVEGVGTGNQAKSGTVEWGTEGGFVGFEEGWGVNEGWDGGCKGCDCLTRRLIEGGAGDEAECFGRSVVGSRGAEGKMVLLSCKGEVGGDVVKVVFRNP